jgi:ATP-dependent RNA helicase DeaD
MTLTTELPSRALVAAIHPALARALERQGYATLTPVQDAVLDGEAEGRDLLVSAQTGSGKTVAFGLALATTLLGEATRFSSKGKPLGLVIAPTRELALQVQRELSWLYADAGIATATCVGGMDMMRERRALRDGAHLVVGTPGRLRDHITRGSLDLSALRAVVLDEADEMLDLGFREDLEFILAAMPEERRTLMFSATVPRAIAELAKTYQRDALRVSTQSAREAHSDIDYQLVLVEPHERESAVINTLLYFDSGSAMVFCHTREAVKSMTTRLTEAGFPVVTLSGELSQAERNRALQAMREGRAKICVATDVAARGIDLPNLDLVIHADMPSKPDTLLHRSGRTGRAGRKGVCVLIVPPRRYAFAQRVLQLAHVNAVTRSAPKREEIDVQSRSQLFEAAAGIVAADASEQDEVQGILARATPEQLAVAFLRNQRRERPKAHAISEVRLPDRSRPKGERPKRYDPLDDRERPGEGIRAEKRRDAMVGAGWFTLSLGRKHRADPKWLLPMICKAGGVSKREVGSIKIGENETRFEIVADKVDAFAEKIARDGTGEKNVRILAAKAFPAEEGQPRAFKRESFKANAPDKRPAPQRGRELSQERSQERSQEQSQERSKNPSKQPPREPSKEPFRKPFKTDKPKNADRFARDEAPRGKAFAKAGKTKSGAEKSGKPKTDRSYEALPGGVTAWKGNKASKAPRPKGKPH